MLVDDGDKLGTLRWTLAPATHGMLYTVVASAVFGIGGDTKARTYP